MQKICSKCKISKELEDFYKDRHSDDGHNSRCKECRDATYKKWYNSEKGQEKARKYSKEYYSKSENKEKTRAIGIFRRFGITSQDYDKMYKNQKGVCAICKNKEICPRHKHLSVDHNHETGKIRGLLCNTCNKALGLFKENPQYLKNAVKYLKKYKL